MEDTIALKKLIDNDGNVIDKKGTALFGWGIFDDEDNEYPAGIGEDNLIYASQVSYVNSEDVIINNNNEFIKCKCGSKYNGEKSFPKVTN